MKKIICIGFLLFVCAAGWEIGGRLSTDAIGLGLGVLFGVMAGVPAALIAMTASRRHDPYTHHAYGSHPVSYQQNGHQQGGYYNGRGQHHPQAYQPQPPVIIVAGMPGQYGQGQPAQVQAQWANGQLQPMVQNGMHYLPGSYPQNAVIDGVARPVNGSNNAPASQRQFRLVGEREQMIEEW